jgi:hypothetical protein
MPLHRLPDTMGSAFRTSVPAAHGTRLPYEPDNQKIYVKTAESSNKRAQAFCPECGTRSTRQT